MKQIRLCGALIALTVAAQSLQAATIAEQEQSNVTQACSNIASKFMGDATAGTTRAVGDPAFNNFVFWNKSNKKLEISFGYFSAPGGGKSNPPKIVNLKPVSAASVHNSTAKLKGTFIEAKINPNSVTCILVQGLDGPHKARIYAFRPGKTIYVRVSEDGVKFGPQTGTFMGLSGKTAFGASMKDNVKDKDINEGIVKI